MPKITVVTDNRLVPIEDHEMPLEKRVETTRLIQEHMHYHGLKGFKKLLREAYFRASDDMEDINKKSSEHYRHEANSIEIEGE